MATGSPAIVYAACSAQQRLSKFAGVESFEVLELFADANEVHRHVWPLRMHLGALALPQGNSRQYPALGGTVEFGDDQARELQRLVKGLDLAKSVLARSTV